MLKLKRLKVNRYRIVRPGTELHFDDGINVLLGINGTGKTTLLDLIAMIFSSNFAGLEEEEFDLEYDFSVPEGSLQIKVHNEQMRSEREGKPDEYSHIIHLTFAPLIRGW